MRVCRSVVRRERPWSWVSVMPGVCESGSGRGGGGGEGARCIVYMRFFPLTMVLCMCVCGCVSKDSSYNKGNGELGRMEDLIQSIPFVVFCLNEKPWSFDGM